MTSINSKAFKYMYFMICLFATIGLSIYSSYRFFINEDTTLVKVTNFLSSKEAVHPSISFCILPPFLERNFDIYNDEKLNLASYKNFLEGKFWDDQMLRIDYDNVTISLSENLINAHYQTHLRDLVDWNVEHFVSFRSSERKCFTVNAPFPEKYLFASWIQSQVQTDDIKNSIFLELCHTAKGK